MGCQYRVKFRHLIVYVSEAEGGELANICEKKRRWVIKCGISASPTYTHPHTHTHTQPHTTSQPNSAAFEPPFLICAHVSFGPNRPNGDNPGPYRPKISATVHVSQGRAQQRGPDPEYETDRIIWQQGQSS